jgi:hypothetical protein
MLAGAAVAGTSAPASADSVYFGTPSVGAAGSPHRDQAWNSADPGLNLSLGPSDGDDWPRGLTALPPMQFGEHAIQDLEAVKDGIRDH